MRRRANVTEVVIAAMLVLGFAYLCTIWVVTYVLSEDLGIPWEVAKHSAAISVSVATIVIVVLTATRRRGE